MRLRSLATRQKISAAGQKWQRGARTDDNACDGAAREAAATPARRVAVAATDASARARARGAAAGPRTRPKLRVCRYCEGYGGEQNLAQHLGIWV